MVVKAFVSGSEALLLHAITRLGFVACAGSMIYLSVWNSFFYLTLNRCFFP